jgi:uncharacterized cupredoxin-like copper-binding protein
MRTIASLILVLCLSTMSVGQNNKTQPKQTGSDDTVKTITVKPHSVRPLDANCNPGNLTVYINLPASGGTWNATYTFSFPSGGLGCGSPGLVNADNVSWISINNVLQTCSPNPEPPDTTITCTVPYTVTQNTGAERSAPLCVYFGSSGTLCATTSQLGPIESLSVNVSGSGTVKSSPAGISCPSACQAGFSYGTAVSLSATAGAGYKFTGWSGACSGTGACPITMFSPTSVTATFTAIPETLTVGVSGSGTVTSSPAGISCPGTCSTAFSYGTGVVLTAAPSSGYAFTGWSGACSGTATTCTLTMNATKSATATFALLETLTMTVTGSGTVTSSPAGISCPNTCSATFPQGKTVTLTASPATGYGFAGWSGACAGNNPTCSTAVNGTESAQATFIQLTTLGTYLIQSSGGSTAYKYYADAGMSQSGAAYTVQVTVRNNGPAIAQVSSNFNSVNIPPGTTQNVVLNFTGNGSSDVQLLFDTVTNTSDPLDIVVWNPFVAKVSDGINLLSATQRDFLGWTIGPGATVTVANDPSLTTGAYLIQSSGGSTAYKYVADAGMSQGGVPYTVQVTVRNNGPAIAQVSSNFNSVNILPGTTQNVVLNFTGNGSSDVQLLFDTVTNTSDPLDIVVWNPFVAKVSDGINLLSPAESNFQGWSIGPGATVTVTNDPSLPTAGYLIQSSGGTTAYKYYATAELSQSGVAYTVQVTVRNNGSAIAQVSSNFNSVNISPGTTQNVVLNFTGDGTNDVQLLFDTVTNTSDPLDITVWNPYVAKVSDGINLLSSSQLAFAGWSSGPGATVAVSSDPSFVTGSYRIQSSGGSTAYKYYADAGMSQSGVAYTLQVTVRNNGSAIAQVSSNFNSVNIPPGTTQNVVLNFTGNGSSDVQLLFDTVTNTSDPLDVTVWNPYIAKASDGINLLSSSQLAFVGWNSGPGATVTVANDPSLTTGAYLIESSGGSTAYKYYVTAGMSQSGVEYTLQLTVRNNGPAIAQVSSNFNTVNISPGTTQDVVLTFTGNGSSDVQLLFDTVTNTSDPLNITVWNPSIAKVSDGINLLSPTQCDFQGWSIGPGATVTVAPLSSPI